MGSENKQAKGDTSAGIGILLLADAPGEFQQRLEKHPEKYIVEIIAELDQETFIASEQKIIYLPKILKAVKNLEQKGCRVTVGVAGCLSYFQREVAAGAKHAVLLSSLTQVPIAQQMLGSSKLVGVLVANAQHYSVHHFESLGVEIGSNFVLGEIRPDSWCRDFDVFALGQESEAFQQAQAEFMEMALEFYEHRPNIGALVLACVGFLPFAEQLQQTLNIPVFSIATLIAYASKMHHHGEAVDILYKT